MTDRLTSLPLSARLIHAARTHLGLSCRDFGKAVHESARRVRAWEAGRHIPPPVVLVACRLWLTEGLPASVVPTKERPDILEGMGIARAHEARRETLQREEGLR